MSYSSAHSSIRTRFADEWAIAQPTIPVAYPNVAFTPPVAAPWVQISIADAESKQVSLGAAENFHRHNGVLTVEVFVPVATGDTVALTLADDAANIFRSWQSVGLQFRTPSIRTLGSDGTWYQVDVLIEFWRDSLYAAAS
jgi:hypothetical protein